MGDDPDVFALAEGRLSRRPEQCVDGVLAECREEPIADLLKINDLDVHGKFVKKHFPKKWLFSDKAIVLYW